IGASAKRNSAQGAIHAPAQRSQGRYLDTSCSSRNGESALGQYGKTSTSYSQLSAAPANQRSKTEKSQRDARRFGDADDVKTLQTHQKRIRTRRGPRAAQRTDVDEIRYSPIDKWVAQHRRPTVDRSAQVIPNANLECPRYR